MHEQHDDPRVGLVFVGFSPPERQAALARHLRWPGRVLADEPRALYALLQVKRAPLWRVYSPGTLLTYARELLRPKRSVVLRGSGEDTRQLGADAVVVDGVVTRIWRPRSPDDRVDPAEVLAAATALAADR